MSESENPAAALRAAVRERRMPGHRTRRALLESGDPALARQAGRILKDLAVDGERPREVDVAVLATCTVGPFEPLLRAQLVGAGLLPALRSADYGTFGMALATGSFTRDGDPGLVAVLLDAGYFLPGDLGAAEPDVLAKYVDARLEELRGLLTGALKHTAATVVVHTVPLPAQVRNGIISVRARAQVARSWYRLNAGLLALAEEHDQVVAVDLVGELAEAPVQACDVRLHRYGDLPYSDDALLLLARLVRRVAQARAGLSRKVLALDLDNTLWGGVLGEAGPQGVQVGGLYPGNCYSELQRTVAGLREQGVVLVLASKNDRDQVEKVLAEHPDVLLRPEAFSARMVDWSAKAGNLRRAAEALSLSTESFVFMDDSDFERAQVGDELPEVAVVSAAGDPAHLVDSLLRHGWFDVMALTDTDRKRPELYRNRALRGDFSSGFDSSEDFLRALDLKVEVTPATEYTVGRIAQLAARTNQFNLTGIRYDEAATRRMSEDAGQLVLSVSVADRFGDEGIVGALWVERTPDVWRVLNLVLSCRVLSRGVERAAVGRLADLAARAGARSVEGHYRPSDRNGVAAYFWTGAGFTPAASPQETETQVFTLDAATAKEIAPEWIALNERNGSPHE
ncbi:HAD-IIIC family phosphatase [Streptomyces sp. HUAS 31]|uniref:HAD-IIIC family phosphatase n=1 Tax=Streptomyces sp. HUAS 31 TaxID=3020055 RepID=UPI00230659DB|nr:HAD-IIIC family phosphatase [Streptomyces sp. HUAS 31]WCD98275.1 HAD-IIIC family phosphatase [Streptomyces sp. HUAS 31]